MPITGKQMKSVPGKLLFTLIGCLFLSANVFSQNDNCSNASIINLIRNGYEIGISPSATVDLSGATVEGGENFAPAIAAAGQTQKSIWYKFVLPTTHALQIKLAQVGGTLAPDDVGFAVYKTGSCLPTILDLSSKLAPVASFGASSNPCIEPGVYLIQVSAKSGTVGSVYLTVETLYSPAAYDFGNQAYDFGTLSEGVKTVSYEVECQSIEDVTEACPSLPNYQEYTKSTAHVFTTPAYFDYIAILLSHQTGIGNETFGLALYKGDIRTTAVDAVGECQPIQTTGPGAARRVFKCGELEPNTLYSIRIFYRQTFTDNVQLSLAAGGIPGTGIENPEPLSGVARNFGTISGSKTDTSIVVYGYLGCNSRHSLHPCETSLPSNGIVNPVNGYTYNLSFFLTFTLTSVTYLTIPASTSACAAPLFMRLYNQGVSTNCSSLTTSNIISQFTQSSPLIGCLQPGTYTLQVLGTDSMDRSTPYSYGSLNNSTSPLCLLSNLARPFNLFIIASTIPPRKALDTTTCSGKPYTLSSGLKADTTGVYNDTLKSASGCDSIIHIIRLNVVKTETKTLIDTFSLCPGQFYTLPWNNALVGIGDYSDTLRYVTGCDSIVRKITVRESKSTIDSIPINICPGGNYSLPWGGVVSSPGEYRDTIRYRTGCDSLVRVVTVFSNAPPLIQIDTTICTGGRYTFSSGATINTTGFYKDTLRTRSGCDSVLLDIHLTVKTVSIEPENVFMCPGGVYNLPWGGTAFNPGKYRDTLMYASGCDSVIRELNLALSGKPDSVITKNTICTGQLFPLPWGGSADSTGFYRDTLKYVSGCDSLIRIIDLTVTPITRKTINASICTGGSYTLPWGQVVNTANTYVDTLRTAKGCDSVIYTVNIGIDNIVSSIDSFNLCTGGSLTLPWGSVVTMPGIYSDTIRHIVGGCDSVIRKAIVSSNTPTNFSIDTSICGGQVYILPSGRKVSSSNIYRDTIKTRRGCDSLIYSINLSVKTVKKSVENVSISAGESYTLPGGTVVNSPGIYTDTLDYWNGCDSLIYTVNLSITTLQLQTTPVSLCGNQSYMLPWGPTVSTTGVYRDTLQGVGGSDSVVRIINLTIQKLNVQSSSISICSGQNYTLPWGRVVNTPGRYADTIHYSSGCDSSIRIIDLSFNASKKQTLNASICSGQSYTLPWGAVVTMSGIYSDTLRNTAGCDSLIRTVNLTTDVRPAGGVTKSNDIDCISGSSQLTAPAGGTYQWTPATGLNDAAIYNPVATPTISTVYHVRANLGNGCLLEDSILVRVTTDVQDGYLVPNAFTPDKDGKNDCFGIAYWGAVTDLNFTIYDRWGGIVFQTTDPSRCWDGSFKSVPLSTGSFVYLISAKTPCGPVIRKGTVTLIR